MGLSDNIKRLRAYYGLTQAELGKIAGVSGKAVWTWENGSALPRIGAVERMARHFGIKKGDIIDDGKTLDDYKDILPLMDKILRLSVVDRARIEERVNLMLEKEDGYVD